MDKKRYMVNYQVDERMMHHMHPQERSEYISAMQKDMTAKLSQEIIDSMDFQVIRNPVSLVSNYYMSMDVPQLTYKGISTHSSFIHNKHIKEKPLNWKDKLRKETDDWLELKV